MIALRTGDTRKEGEWSEDPKSLLNFNVVSPSLEGKHDVAVDPEMG